VFLVRNHLMMSQVAQKGDLDDHTTVEEFARTVGSIDRLKALYLLTYADMRAVAPKVYNNWRDMLLSDLYMRALKVLEQGDREAVDPARRLATVKAGVRETLLAASAPEADVAAFLAEMPDRYFFTAPEDDIPLHFDLMRSLADRPLVCRIRHFPELEFSEFIVVTRDRPGLFSMIAGALTANNLNILSARITTRTNGVAMDVFRISHQMGEVSMALEEDRWLRVEHDLERVITDQQDIAALVAAAHHVQSAGRKFVRHVPTEVTVDNRTSEQFTVIDVFTQDRLGVLYTITRTLADLELDIHLSKVATEAHRVADVFYVRERDGKKLDSDRVDEVRLALAEALGRLQLG
jgi:[protein-PII] uridylyltransferase